MSLNKIIFAILTVVFTGILVFILVVRLNNNDTINPSSDNGASSQNIPIIVMDTNPSSGQTDVYSGEIKITISLNREIFSENDINISITPQPASGFEFTNSFPSKTLSLQILGGLTPSTTHTVAVNDPSGNTLYTWFFTTSNQSPESSSAEVNKIQRETIANYYPLFDFVPFQTEEFSLDYTERLTLEVKINGNKTPQIENSVENWIRAKGVDPSTHTINYISQ